MLSNSTFHLVSVTSATNLFGLELFSSLGIVCLCHRTSPSSCSNSTDEREETLGLSRAPRAGAARRRGGGSAVDGQGRCPVRGRCCTGEPRLRGARGGSAGKEEPQQPGARRRGGWPALCLEFFFFSWQRVAGKVAGPLPGSSELRLVPPFHEH